MQTKHTRSDPKAVYIPCPVCKRPVRLGEGACLNCGEQIKAKEAVKVVSFAKPCPGCKKPLRLIEKLSDWWWYECDNDVCDLKGEHIK